MSDFLVFDEERGLELLGEEPRYEFMFAVDDGMFPPFQFGSLFWKIENRVCVLGARCADGFIAMHEAPVYSPATNKLYFSQLQPGFLPQLVVNLNQEPPYLGELVSDPPVYAPNGGTILDGL